jgi:hypothetical protein
MEKKRKEKETVENKGAFLLVVFYCYPIGYPTETMVNSSPVIIWALAVKGETMNSVL